MVNKSVLIGAGRVLGTVRAKDCSWEAEVNRKGEYVKLGMFMHKQDAISSVDREFNVVEVLSL